MAMTRSIPKRRRARNATASPTKSAKCETIFSDEFRIELQPIEDGPTITVSGHGHDTEFTIVVTGVSDGESDPELACIVLTLENLEELVSRLKSATRDFAEPYRRKS
jgi:hypothetical protein